MTNNDVLRRLRYALHIKNDTIIEYFKLADHEVSQEKLDLYLKKEDEEGYATLNDKIFTYFLDGLIISKRGKQEPKEGQAPRKKVVLNNNEILKKLRIALKFRDDDIITILKQSDFRITKSELGALFRPKDHKHYRECGDQVLRNFITGLTK